MRARAPLVLAVTAVALAGCATTAPQDDSARMASLKDAHDRLHERLEEAAAKEPLVASAFADRGQVALAIRSGRIEELAGSVARRYLDRVTVDLSEAKATARESCARRPSSGASSSCRWTSRRRRETRPSASPGTRRGSRTSSARNFELTRDIRGRVLAQRHLVSGALRHHNTGESLTATPVFPHRRIRLKLDLTARSWGVRLPDSIFRTVSLPARLQKSVTVGQRTVGLRLTAESLRVEAGTLWSSASVQVQADTKP